MGNRSRVSVLPTPGTARISSTTLVLRASKDSSSMMAERSHAPKMPQMSLMPSIFSRSRLTICKTLKCSLGRTSMRIMALARLLGGVFACFLVLGVISITAKVASVNY